MYIVCIEVIIDRVPLKLELMYKGKYVEGKLTEAHREEHQYSFFSAVACLFDIMLL